MDSSITLEWTESELVFHPVHIGVSAVYSYNTAHDCTRKFKLIAATKSLDFKRIFPESVVSLSDDIGS